MIYTSSKTTSMATRYTIMLLLFITIDARKTKFENVSLEELSGVWEHDHFQGFVSIYPRDNITLEVLCREGFSAECLNSIVATEYAYTVDADTLLFRRDIYSNPSKYKYVLFKYY